MATHKPDSYALWSMTAKKRSEARAALQKLAGDLGVTFIQEEYEGDREVSVTLARPPYKVWISIDGDSQCGAFLAHWTTNPSSQAKYPEGFELAISGSVNPYHRAKATIQAATFDDFQQFLKNGFEFLAAQEPTNPTA